MDHGTNIKRQYRKWPLKYAALKAAEALDSPRFSLRYPGSSLGDIGGGLFQVSYRPETTVLSATGLPHLGASAGQRGLLVPPTSCVPIQAVHSDGALVIGRLAAYRASFAFCTTVSHP